MIINVKNCENNIHSKTREKFKKPLKSIFTKFRLTAKYFVITCHKGTERCRCIAPYTFLALDVGGC